MVQRFLPAINSFFDILREHRWLRYFFYFIAILPLYFYRDYTPDNELRYLSIVDEALRNNTWFTFSNHGEIYADKPPLFFWLLMLTKQIFGHYALAVTGLFSLIPALLIMCVMDKWLITSAPRDHQPEILGGLLLFSTTYFLGATFVMRMDMLMCLFIVLTLKTFYAMYQGDKSHKNKLLLVLYVFLGAFTKGPSAIAMPLLVAFSFLIYKRQIKTIFSYISIGSVFLFLGLCGFWVLMIYLESGTDYLHNIIFKQTIGRGINSFHHKQPFYYYMLTSLYTFLPWVFLYIAALYMHGKNVAKQCDLADYFLLIVISSFVLFSLISSKLDIYLLPIYPFLIYYTALRFNAIKDKRFTKISIAIPSVTLLLAFPILFIAPRFMPFPITQWGFFIVGACGLTVGGIIACRNLRKRIQISLISVCISMLFFLFIGSFGLKQINPYFGLHNLANESLRLQPDTNKVDYGYYRFRGGSDMDVFLGVSPKRLLTVDELIYFLETEPNPLVYIKDKDFKKSQFDDFRKNAVYQLKPVGSYYIVTKLE